MASVQGHSPSATLPAVVEALMRQLKAEETFSENNEFAFVAEELVGLVSTGTVPGTWRIRIYLAPSDEDEVTGWVQRQPPPTSGILQADYLDDERCPRLVFERPDGPVDWSNDPLLDDIETYRRAWDVGAVVRSGRPAAAFARRPDPRDLEPANAWLLKGDEASSPTTEELQDAVTAAAAGIYDYLWTTASQTRCGDLLYLYFMEPTKAVRFVARAASDAFFSRDIQVNADNAVRDAQWWCTITPPVEVEPVPFRVLQEASGGHMPLKGRSGLYLRPDLVDALSLRAARAEDQPEVDRIATTPTGSASLPDPTLMSADEWRNLAAGALALEAHVSQYVVEPLLRLLLAGTDLTSTREFPVGRGRADYVLLHEGRPTHVVEVKKVMRVDSRRSWQTSVDIEQAVRYASALDVPATLIDSHHVVLLPGAGVPPIRLERTTCDDGDLERLRSHLLSR